MFKIIFVWIGNSGYFDVGVSQDSSTTSALAAKQHLFIFFLLSLGPEIAVNAANGRLGQGDLSSNLENHSLNGSSFLLCSPLQNC